MNEKERNKRIRDLLYFVSCIINLVHDEIEKIMRGCGRTYEELKDSNDVAVIDVDEFEELKKIVVMRAMKS